VAKVFCEWVGVQGEVAREVVEERGAVGVFMVFLAFGAGENGTTEARRARRRSVEWGIRRERGSRQKGS
jgi:hypothetical protein